jgi:hypothetical protein
MRLILVVSAGFLLVVGGQPTAAGLPPQTDASCQGSSCLNIYNVRVGTRCGTKDSIEADFSNESGSQYLRGYIIFTTLKGKEYSATNLVKPGQKVVGAAYTCHGLGTPTGIANTGTDPNHLDYPLRH